MQQSGGLLPATAYGDDHLFCEAKWKSSPASPTKRRDIQSDVSSFFLTRRPVVIWRICVFLRCALSGYLWITDIFEIVLKTVDATDSLQVL